MSQQEVFTTMTSQDALMQAQISVMRQISDGQGAIVRNLEKLAEKVEKVEHEVAVFHGADVVGQIAEMKRDVKDSIKEFRNEFDSIRREHTASMDLIWADIKEYRERERERWDAAKALSEQDRARLWVAVESHKGELNIVKSRLVTLFTAIGVVVSVVIAYLMEKILGRA